MSLSGASPTQLVSHERARAESCLEVATSVEMLMQGVVIIKISINQSEIPVGALEAEVSRPVPQVAGHAAPCAGQAAPGPLGQAPVKSLTHGVLNEAWGARARPN